MMINKNNCLPLRGQFPLLVLAVIAVFWLVNENALASTKDVRPQVAREFVVASSDNFPPVNMLDKDGNLTGFGRDLSTAVIRAIGGQTNYIHSPVWSEVLDYLNLGKADFIHDTGYSKERDIVLDFSDPILEMKEVIIVRAGQYNITGIESLKGKTVACVNQHITHLYLMQFPAIRCRIVRTPAEGLYSLIAGDVDAFAYPEPIVTYLSQELRFGDKIKVTGEPLRTLKWSMAVRVGDKVLLSLLNEGIRKVRQSGEYERIYAKWFGKKILSGYSQKEIRIFGLIAISVSLAFGISIGLFILYWRLRNRRNELLKIITERKQAEDALRRMNTLLDSVVENIPNMIFLKDAGNLRFVRFNRAGEDLLGHSREDLLGKSDYDFFPKEQADFFTEKDRDVLRGKELVDIPEEPLQTRNKGKRTMHTKKVPILNAKGEPEYLLGISEDITERKQAERRLQDTLESLRKAVGTTIQVISSTVEARDPYTSGHQIRSADLARAIAMEMGLPQDKINGIRMAGSIHDIGKISIPAEILSKPTKLSDLEFSLIKEHARRGYEMLKDLESPWPLAEIVYQHHERMDGSGYPRNLIGDDILIEARILSVADVVEAMASHRPYRAGLGIEAALNEIEKNSDIIYDKTVAEACLRLFREKGFKLEGA
ncbi:MAG: transporter substrate-binding domain-containing protein [Syntrophales bacterium]|jgi:PAS domain S-box-containing protein|nr:transporter substrate-binding domain-containing protein [Syntrophales bacterium]